MIKKQRLAYLVSAFLISLFIAACGMRLVPKASQTGVVDLESNIITKEKEGVIISVQTMEWHYDPYYLDQFFTPILILIKNGTDKNLTIKYDNFVMVDSQGEQYNIIPPEQVEAFFARGYPYPYRGYLRGNYSPYDTGLDFEYNLPYKGVYTVLSLLSLPEVEIVPKAQIRGFLFFKKVGTNKGDLSLRMNLNGLSEKFEFEMKR